jgi:hypothetical protein
MDALLIGPTLAVSVAATVLAGKALLHALLKAMETLPSLPNSTAEHPAARVASVRLRQ